MFLLCSNDGPNILFDPQIDHLIAIIGENDVNKIFADVMYVSFNGSDQEFCLRRSLSISFLHVRFEKSHSGFHCFCRLQNERKLHLT